MQRLAEVKMELGDVVAGNMDALRGGVASDTVTSTAWALSPQENVESLGMTSKSIRKLHDVTRGQEKQDSIDK